MKNCIPRRAVFILTAVLLLTWLFIAPPALALSDQETMDSTDGAMNEATANFTDEELAAFEEKIINESPVIQPEEFYRGVVLEIIDERDEEITDGFTESVQEIKVKIQSGQEKNKVILVTHGGIAAIAPYQKVKTGDKVVLVKIYKVDGGEQYFVNDHYRLTPLLLIFAIFAAAVIFFGRQKGAGSLAGLALSILVLIKLIVPRIIAGDNPLVVTLIGASLIAGIALFLAHGFNRRTSVALLSTIISLALALCLAEIFVNLAFLFGKGSEEAFFIQMGNLGYINLRGLLLAGIVIGTLGVLDDVTTTQTAVVGELKRANHRLSFNELFQRGLIVGREHIASLVNTLVLAYAGAALPLFILFIANENVPLWTKINSEILAEEFVRTIVGSLALILAVPITTALAAYLLKNEKQRNPAHLTSPHH